MKHVLVPLADGIEEIETICIVDILRRAGAKVTLAALDCMTIVAAHGVRLTVDCLIHEVATQFFDMIVLPGGLPGAEYLRDSEILRTMLTKQKAAGRWYAAICASPVVVLHHHHLVDDIKATAYPSFLMKLPHAVADCAVVVDRNCITSQGPGTALTFALCLVEQLFGLAHAVQLKNELCY